MYALRKLSFMLLDIRTAEERVQLYFKNKANESTSDNDNGQQRHTVSGNTNGSRAERERERGFTVHKTDWKTKCVNSTNDVSKEFRVQLEWNQMLFHVIRLRHFQSMLGWRVVGVRLACASDFVECSMRMMTIVCDNKLLVERPLPLYSR